MPLIGFLTNLLRHRKCAVDTMVHWKSSLKEVEETEAMRRLLTALRMVQGFEELAAELGQQQGMLEQAYFLIIKLSWSIPS